jgi:hypothetical protein
MAAAPILDGLAISKNRQKMGIINYFLAHHYYLWSPFEKSVIIILSGLSISYFQFIEAVFIPLIIYLILLILYCIFYVNTNDLNIKIQNNGPAWPLLVFILSIFSALFIPIYISFTICMIIFVIYSKINLSSLFKMITSKDYYTLLIIGLVIIAGQYIHTIVNPKDYITTQNIIILLSLGFIFSFVLGSSSKYAGITLLMSSLVGVKFLPIIFITEYVGYFLSPVHKCVLISKQYFDTPLIRFYFHLIIYSLFLIIPTYFMFFVFGG